jgi:hypothetical protein
MTTREIHAVILYEYPNGRVSAQHHDVSSDCVELDLVILWAELVERAQRARWIARLALTDYYGGRSVVITYPPITRAERERSDDAHAETIEDAIRMLNL